MIKKELFNDSLQQLAEIARALSHPARLQILQYLASQSSCISGDISNELPLSRTTVSQHLQELKKLGIIKGEVTGIKVKYCINQEVIQQINEQFNGFFDTLKCKNSNC
ncbi:ArsR family transcriptional regulator [Prolixibacteraceae bacterium JC049]|nr:ArsR family transcriptional regulator [Prolixibacteraceae bacterium JC049]